MALERSLVVALALFSLGEAQYGPLKGSSSRRTTTPFPPGFHSDNQLYNSDSNQIGPSSGQKTPAGVASYSDNPWLNGIISQNPGTGSSYQPTKHTQPCNVPGHVCVPRHQCQGGQTTSPGSGHKECDANAEVCCRYGQQQPSQQPAHHPPPISDPRPGPTYQSLQQPTHQAGPSYQQPPQPALQPGPTHQPSQQPIHQPSYQQAYHPAYQLGPIYQPMQRPGSPQHGQNYYPGSQVHPGQQPTQVPGPSNQPGLTSQGLNHQPGSHTYRPGTNGRPIGGSIYDTGAARPGSSYVTPAYGPYTGPLNTTPHPGCPAALKCVDESYCDANGVMHDTIQVPIPGQDRVPLSECQNIDTGIIGKCCRDPNYKDPWPDMDTHGHGHHDDGHYHQQGTSSDACGSSATCIPQSECPGDRQVQPGKHCQALLDGSTGVCCSKMAVPSISNNQHAATPAITAHRPTPAQQYYTPKPSYSNNPFLQGDRGRLPGAAHSQNLPNAIPDQQKGHDQSISKPFGPGYPTIRPFNSQPSSASTTQTTVDTPANLPVFPQIATNNSVYSPRPVQAYEQPSTNSVYNSQSQQSQQQSSSISMYTARPSQAQQQLSSTSAYTPQPIPTHQESLSHSTALPGSNVHNPFSTTVASPVESNDISLPLQQLPQKVSPTKGVGPPGGYPFLAPTTESNQKKLFLSDCGVRRDVQRPNGPGGLETGFGEFPWQVQITAIASQTPLCSGAILSTRIIVTAAHCVDDFKSVELSVKAGDWKLGGDTAEEPKPAQTRQVTAIARHPNYDPVSRFYDMAALVLLEPLQIDEHVNVLCLGGSTSPEQKPAGNNCVVTGWGKASLQSNSLGSTMHSIAVDFIANEQCEDTFRKTNLGKYFRLNKSFVCAVPKSPNDDLCQVDVGSPIACQKGNGLYELVGIYSWDVGCHQPVAASSVDKPWVQSVMDKPVEQIKQEEQAELQKKENLGFNPQNSDSNKPGFSQGYGKK